jgi:hypothetical protein
MITGKSDLNNNYNKPSLNIKYRERKGTELWFNEILYINIRIYVKYTPSHQTVPTSCSWRTSRGSPSRSGPIRQVPTFRSPQVVRHVQAEKMG